MYSIYLCVVVNSGQRHERPMDNFVWETETRGTHLRDVHNDPVHDRLWKRYHVPNYSFCISLVAYSVGDVASTARWARWWTWPGLDGSGWQWRSFVILAPSFIRGRW